MSIVRAALIEEIKQKAELSQDYYNIIQSAKTETKKRIYQKKLKNHNDILADLIISLDKLDKSKYTHKDTNNSVENVDVKPEQTM